ncbi:MAG: hypothetical protein WCL54_06355 [Clostridia bacterium]
MKMKFRIILVVLLVLLAAGASVYYFMSTNGIQTGKTSEKVTETKVPELSNVTIHVPQGAKLYIDETLIARSLIKKTEPRTSNSYDISEFSKFKNEVYVLPSVAVGKTLKCVLLGGESMTQLSANCSFFNVFLKDTSRDYKNFKDYITSFAKKYYEFQIGKATKQDVSTFTVPNSSAYVASQGMEYLGFFGQAEKVSLETYNAFGVEAIDGSHANVSIEANFLLSGPGNRKIPTSLTGSFELIKINGKWKIYTSAFRGG